MERGRIRQVGWAGSGGVCAASSTRLPTQANWGGCHLGLERVAAKLLLTTPTTVRDSHVNPACRVVSRFIMAWPSGRLLPWPGRIGSRAHSPARARPRCCQSNKSESRHPTRLVSLSASGSAESALPNQMQYQDEGKSEDPNPRAVSPLHHQRGSVYQPSHSSVRGASERATAAEQRGLAGE